MLGSLYRDTISGYVGTATARAVYLHGAVEVLVVAETGQGDSRERWIREGRLEPTTKSAAGFAS